jgi:hypothetical protein
VEVGYEEMKIIAGMVLTLLVSKYLVAHHIHVGFWEGLLLWWVLAVIFPKRVHNPLHLAHHHGRRFFRAGLHKKVGVPIAGFVVYLIIPVTLPVMVLIWLGMLFIWLWSLGYQHLKGKYRSIGQRLRKESNDIWKRTARATAEEVRFILTIGPVCRQYVVGAIQALQDYHRRWSDEPVAGMGGEDGCHQDQLGETGGEGTN